MKYFLVTKSSDGSFTRTFATADEVNEAVKDCINAGYKESTVALNDQFIREREGKKHYAVIQGIQLATTIAGVTVE